MYNLKIVSGGQTGADLAGLWAARLFGIATGGMAPKGWKTQLGSMPQLGEFFGLGESESGYHGRTLQNCEISDLTLVFASNIKSPGTRLTLHHCIKNKIHYRVLCFSEGSSPDKYVDNNANAINEMIKQFYLLHEGEQMVINIAGNSTSTSSPTFTMTFLSLCKLFTQLGYKSPTLEKYDIRKVEALLRDSYDNTTFETLHNIFRSNN